MGGYVAFEILRQARDRVARLALLNTSACPETPDRTQRHDAQIALAQEGFLLTSDWLFSANGQPWERLALTFREYEPLAIPGLLQTAEYARHIFRVDVADLDVAEAVVARLERQTILYDEQHRFEFVIHEAALRWRVGPAAMQAAQMDRIRQVATLSNVQVGIIPIDLAAPYLALPPLVILEGMGDDTDLVLVETMS